MSPLKTKILNILGGVLFLAVCIFGWQMYSAYTINSNTAQLRESVQSLLDSMDASKRKEFSIQGVQLARTLQHHGPPVSTSGNLYLMALNPIAGEESAIQMPKPMELDQLDSKDLMLNADVLFRSGRLGPADQLITLLLDRDDADRQHVLETATAIRIELGRNDDVIEHSQELMELDPESASPYFPMARVYRMQSHWEKYLKAVEECLQRSDDPSPALLVAEIEGLTRVGNYDSAHEKFAALGEVFPDAVKNTPTLHARLLMQKSELDKAMTILDDYLKIDPEDVEALVLKGQILVSLEKYEEAVTILTEAIGLEESNEEAYYHLGQAHARLDHKDIAKAFLEQHQKMLDAKILLYEMEQVAAREPWNVEVRVKLANKYGELKLFELAESWAESAKAADGLSK